MSNTSPNIDKLLIGASGVHFTVSELSLRGIIALPTIKNTRGFDMDSLVMAVSVDLRPGKPEVMCGCFCGCFDDC